MMRLISALVVVATCCCSFSTAFSPTQYSTNRAFHLLKMSETEITNPSEELKKRAEAYEEPKMNPDRPELPELKGDFDWDAKFGNDDDWITEGVPGKIVLNEIELATQVTALGKLEEQWKRERIQKEYDDAQILGFGYKAELLNGRLAMFFLVVGLLTELWTGISIPGQIEEMLRVGGVIGFDG